MQQAATAPARRVSFLAQPKPRARSGLDGQLPFEVRCRIGAAESLEKLFLLFPISRRIRLFADLLGKFRDSLLERSRLLETPSLHCGSSHAYSAAKLQPRILHGIYIG